MYSIRLFNTIDEEGLKRLPEEFEITDADNCDGIILRSHKMSEKELTPRLAAVARAGAGVNNIPIADYAAKGVVVFNTPGANANAVMELVILGALISARRVFDGMQWVSSLLGAGVEVEKEVEAKKSAFAGPEIFGKKIGVIGLGAVGVRVANTFDNLGAKVYGYDPFISIEHAWDMRSDIARSGDVEWLFENCDIVSLHVPYVESTKEFVNTGLLNKAKNGIRILNFARGELVDNEAIIAAVRSGKVGAYVTDFPNEKLLGIEGILNIPHLGASTPEAETNCAIMAAEQIADFLINGNITNSVNYPDLSLGPLTEKTRITLTHMNVPNMVGQITTVLAEDAINIANMINKSRDEYAYTMLDVDSEVNDAIFEELLQIDGVLKVRRLVSSNK